MMLHDRLTTASLFWFYYSRILKSVILIFLSKQKSIKKTKYLPRMQETSDFLFLLPMIIQKMNAFLDKKPIDKKLF